MKMFKAEKSWSFIILFLILQFGFLFIIRTSTYQQDYRRLRRTKATKMLSSPKISTLPIQYNVNNPSFETSSKPTRHLYSDPNHQSETTIFCNRSHPLYDWCHLKGQCILDPMEAKFYVRLSSPSKNPQSVEKVRPYPRKMDNATMSYIREITLTTKKSLSTCIIMHNTPALVFSIGGFTGNFFHDFNEGFVPLYITINTLFPDQEVTLVVTNYAEWWYGKYEAILPQFSNHPIVNLDNQTVTHCFTSVAVGLISHGPMTINPDLIPHRKSFLDFRALLEEGYKKCLVWPPPKIKGRPRLVLISRVGQVGRVILNQDKVIKAAQEEGFDVVIFEPSADTYLCDVYRLINGSHAIMGVHGAALTHSLFLQPGASFLQVVPLGGDWLAKTYFSNLATGMKLEYMEYKILPEESSLVHKYGKGHILIRDSQNIASRNWSALHSIFLRRQDVRIDIARFRGFLRIAYVNARKLMEHQGFHVRRRTKIKKFIKPPIFSYTHSLD